MSSAPPSPTDPAPDAEQPATEQLIRQLYALGNVRRALSRIAAEQLTTPGFGPLVTLHRSGPMRVSELAARLHVDLSVASRQVAALQAAQLVERSPDPDDRRAHLLHVTEAGRAALADVHHHLTAALADALTDWSDEDLLAAARSLQRLNESFEA